MTDKRRRFPWGGFIIIILFVLLDAVLAVMLADGWQLRVSLLGEAEKTVECGEAFLDPGAEAVFGGVRILPGYFSPKVTVHDAPDTRVPGDYAVRYSSRVLWFVDSCFRTVHVVDTTPPVVTLLGTGENVVQPGEAYAEEGYTAYDSADGDLTDRVERWEEGGFVYYRVADKAGNVALAQRHIPYYDAEPPAVTLLGEARIILPYGAAYEEPGYTATDNVDGDLTDRVVVSGEVIPDQPGDYVLRYSVEDEGLNRGEAVRTVTVAPKSAGTVYLTFDDGPSKYTEQLLEILDRYDVKVTFFVVNYGYNDVIGKEYAAGHTIGVHSATHDYHTIYASEEAYFEDLQEMNDIIYRQTGAYTDLIRFPGGSSNTISDFNPGIMTRLTQAVADRGYQYFDWNVSSGDAGETTDPDEVYQNVIDGIKQHETSIVLMHDSKSYTVEAVERIVVWCLENGYSLRTLTKDGPASHHRINN